MVLDMKVGLSWIPAGRNIFLELCLPILIWWWEKMNAYYDLAQGGTLVKTSYLAVNQLNKAVSVIYVIRLAGSNATQLVTHT